ncbi:UPF0172-domain-containing protein [Meredithblackwellia eburnea MCA 4105]
MASYTISPLAYTKLVFHAAKWPSDSVTGLLVGTFDQKTKKGDIEDVIPLLHHWTELSMAMEAGLQLVEVYVKSKSQSFLGLYVANAGLEDASIPSSTSIVADALVKELGQAVVLVVDNSKLGSTSESPLLPFLSTSSFTSSTPSPAALVLTSPSIVATALEGIKSGKHIAVGDFDEHAEDLTVDWLVNGAIKA